MNFKQIEDAVKNEIEDFSVEFFTDIPAVINEVYADVVDMIDPGVPSLKKVESLGTVVNQAYVPQPPDSSGKITSIWNADTDCPLVRVDGGVEALRALLGKLNGTDAINYWTLEGFNIWHGAVSDTAVNLEVIHYAVPDELAGDGDIPIHIPKHLHRSILVHGVSFELFSRIEQEGENEARETAKQSILFTEGKDKFANWVSRRQTLSGRVASDV